MTHQEKIDWMILFAHRNQVVLTLEGECGFGRECVGILADGHYPEYKWYDSEWKSIDHNGEVWTPPSAYHKDPCVAVLGRGEDAENQLYEWLKWFDDNGFKVETSFRDDLKRMDPLQLLISGTKNIRMVKQIKGEA